ncbi:hypothetical protein A9267_10035 [Shewanella sp. UCD-FRSSP16_17]|uniref:hypothetical protein n=1 Tax=Shewanella sp. UCD-FRSSP16_17 TaxID=1853256 RepID=UPI0007EEEE53|nr:hypothetical protein [Shewanella sp. UCD-FRSSP16_17]OBT08056.1 hypothetical protein A9267_10035 [Shewanella sp. UCD-FRSSP16_17]
MSKDALPQQSLSALLDDSFKQLESEYQAGQPIVFSTGYISNLFLPPPDAVLKLFGISNPMLLGIEVAEQDLNLPLEIKSSSRHKLTTSGVGLPSVKKMYHWTRELFSRAVTKGPIFNEQDFVQSTQVNSNALGWYSLLNNSEDMKKANISDGFNEFQPLLTFFRKRCKADVECFEHIKQQVDKQGVKSITLAEKLQFQSPFWLMYSEVENSTWEVLIKLLLQHEQKPIKDKETELLTFRCVVRLQLDFYLEAIAHYEAGVVLAKHENKDEVVQPNGMLTKGLMLYADGVGKTCFDGFLTEMIRVINKIHGDTSWRTVAGCIDIDESAATGMGDSLKDRQYNCLKDWRKGKNLPSYSKLQWFFIHLFGLEDAEFIDMMLAYSKIAIGLDSLFNSICTNFKGAHFSEHELEGILKQVLKDYPSYYLRCIERELQEVTENEA